MGCLDDDTAAAFAMGTASDPRSVEQHIAACEPCRVRVAILATEVRTHAGSVGPTLERCPTATVLRSMTRIAPPGAGERLGRYIVLRPLGAGGMGLVVAAHDPELDRSVAIKLVRADVWSDTSDASRSQLRREAQAMARLHHPNVVAVHDVGTHDGQLFVAMQLVPGAPLDAWLRAGRSWRTILATCVGAGRGLAAAHRAGLVHLDIKPANILVDGEGTARVADFGLAVLGRAVDGGAACGTPAYMAPEQHQGIAADARADQFAFAVTVFEALFGKRPYVGGSKAAIAEAIAAGRIAPVERGGVPRRIYQALGRALAAEPAARFATVEDLLDELAPRPRVARRLGFAAAITAAVVAVIAVVAPAEGGNRGGRVHWDPATQCAVLQAAAEDELDAGDWDEAAATLHAAVRIAERADLAATALVARGQLAAIRAHLGNVRAAR
jgi:hypothetical protein